MSVPRQLIPRSEFALVDALNAEWSELDNNRLLAGYGRAEVGRWASEHPALADCSTVQAVLEAISERPDEVLAALIAVHQDGAGGLAGRVVVQTMLGKLVTMARRDRHHAVEDYIGQLWARIGCYPLLRRPRRIAANLALDTLKAVTRDGARATTFVSVPVSADELERAGLAQVVASGHESEDLSAHRVLRSALHLELIDDATRRLLAAVYVEGLSSAHAAERFGLTSSTVRFRCSKAIRHLAAHAAVIRDAA